MPLACTSGHTSSAHTAPDPRPCRSCRASILGLPLSVRRLLAHAYFSKVWNVVVSERLRRHGLATAREGELVLPPAQSDAREGSPFARRNAVHVVTEAEAAAGAYDCRSPSATRTHATIIGSSFALVTAVAARHHCRRRHRRYRWPPSP